MNSVLSDLILVLTSSIKDASGKHLLKEVLKSGSEALCRPDADVNHSTSNPFFNHNHQESSPWESPSF